MMVRNFMVIVLCIGQEESIAWYGMTSMIQEKGTTGSPLTKQIGLTNLTYNMMRCQIEVPFRGRGMPDM